MVRMRSLPILLAAVTVGFAQQRNESLHELFKDYFEDQLREAPEFATIRGRTEYNDRWTDWSRAAVERRFQQRQRYLERLRPLESQPLSEQDNLSARFFRYLLERQNDTESLNVYLLRMQQMFGAHTRVFQTIDLMPRNTVRDYENIIRRLSAVPTYIDQNIDLFQDAIARGLVQPSMVVERVQAQLRAQVLEPAASTELLTAFRKWPAGIPESERQRLSAQAAMAYTNAFVPAWRKLADFVEKTYAPKARTSIAASSLPDGQKLYAAQVRTMTTTTLSPQQIHELGKNEVQRLEGEMLQVVKEAGIQGTVHDYEKQLADSPDQHFRSKEEMLAYCRNVAKIAEPELPRLFRKIPRLLYGIRAIPAAVEASTASNAQFPAPDWSRPGWFNLNAYQPEKQVKYDKEALVLHEAVPGHIFQGSIALEMGELPDFRKTARLSAYGEGWALYAESLGAELGLYRDPPSRLGQLASERFRAVRLVVDTGMHAIGWSRAQAVDYFTTHAPAMSIAEIDRYISWPAQALSYKMGQLKILELRQRAEKELGSRFDVRDFHDVVLRNGPLPMELLEETVGAYIRQKRDR
jgi:prolyl oligopeptidase